MRRRILGILIGFVARAWVWTLRYRRLGPPVEGPALLAFWHGDQLALLGARPPGNLVAPISMSRDGDVQVEVMARFGIAAIRGSSSRGGTAALRGLLRALRRGDSALMAVDGPRGPRGVVKPGIIYLAARTGLPIYPVSVVVRRGHRLVRPWDRFLLPCPWTRTVVCFGPAWHPSPAPPEDQCRALATAIEAARLTALNVVNPRPATIDTGEGLDRTYEVAKRSIVEESEGAGKARSADR